MLTLADSYFLLAIPRNAQETKRSSYKVYPNKQIGLSSKRKRRGLATSDEDNMEGEDSGHPRLSEGGQGKEGCRLHGTYDYNLASTIVRYRYGLGGSSIWLTVLGVVSSTLTGSRGTPRP